jgi:glycosyltransferase involved in cell wall biosynthesis
MALRIVFDVRHIRDFGIGTYIRNLLAALGEIDRESHYVLTALPDDVDEFSSLPPNFETVAYTHRDSERIDHLAYPWFVRGFAPSLVHIPLNIVPLFLPKPYVVTIHDMSSLLFGQRLKGGWTENAQLYRFRRGLIRADKLIAVSEATRRDVENLLGIPGDRIRLVYSAPDPGFFEGAPAALARAESRSPVSDDMHHVLERYQMEHPFILYVGRIQRHKNVPRLIEAFAVVRGELESHPKYRDLRLVIIGDEISRHPEVRRAVVQTRSEQAVRFLGFLPFNTLKVFYAAASAFVFPSLYEGFGLPPLEAMASGTPVVTTGVSSLPEVVGSAAVLVNPENVFDMARGIREVLIDEQLRHTLIERGFERLTHFSWRSTASQVLGVYRDVAGVS